MLYLIFAVCCSALVSLIMRLSGEKVKSDIAMLAVNYLMCSAVASWFLWGSGLPGISTGLFGIVGGILYLASFVLLQRNVAKNGVVLSSTFMKLGVLVSIAVSVLAFGEVPGITQALGVVLALGAIILVSGKGEGAAASRLGLVLLLLVGGMADAMSKIFEELGVKAEESWFLFGTFFTAMVLCLGMMLSQKQRPGKWELLFGLLIGIPNYFSARFFLSALETVPAVIAFPTYSVGSILVVSAVGVLAFREKLTKRQWLGIGGTLAALILLNI